MLIRISVLVVIMLGQCCVGHALHLAHLQEEGWWAERGGVLDDALVVDELTTVNTTIKLITLVDLSRHACLCADAQNAHLFPPFPCSSTFALLLPTYAHAQ